MREAGEKWTGIAAEVQAEFQAIALRQLHKERKLAEVEGNCFIDVVDVTYDRATKTLTMKGIAKPGRESD